MADEDTCHVNSERSSVCSGTVRESPFTCVPKREDGFAFALELNDGRLTLRWGTRGGWWFGVW
jgi:hypothetical protein